MSDNGKPIITKNPSICGGRACIAGHRVRVMDIVACHEKRGMSREDIVSQYPGITLDNVSAAMEYYSANRQEIEESFRGDEEWAKWLTEKVPSKARERLRG